MTLRRLTAQDAPALRALWHEGLSTRPEAFLMTPEELAATPEKAFVQGIVASLFVGAFEKDTLIGFVKARRSGITRLRHTADIGPLFVTQKHQRQGHARALMQAVMDLLRAHGVLQCELSVDTENTAADHLYASLGFVPFGRRPRSVFIDGTPRTDLLMICALGGTDLNAAAPAP